MTRRVLVLGAGRIGSAIALDLAASGAWQVTVADARPEVLGRFASCPGVRTVPADLADGAALARLVAGHDLAVGALPSHLGFAALEAVIEARVDCVDISFMPEDPLRLDDRARAAGVTIVADCGIAPGVSNLIAGWAASRFDPCERLEILVGGLPVERRWPYDYKAGFAPADVLEEYVRPARIVESGRVVTRQALSEVERVDIPGVGTLEAFLTDGLRSLVRTLPVPFMKEKTLRYPGHADLIRALRETGFFSRQEIDAGGRRVRPLDVTTALLFPKWAFAEGEPDVTVLRVTADGRFDGGAVRHRWDLVDRYDPASGLRSMSRATAFPATITAGILADGSFVRPGVCAPEALGAVPGLLDRVLAELAAKGVACRRSVENLDEVAAAVGL